MGSVDEVSFADARMVADSVAARLQEIEPADIEFCGLRSVDGALVLMLRKHRMLDDI